jgi:hypothetical protein
MNIDASDSFRPGLSSKAARAARPSDPSFAGSKRSRRPRFTPARGKKMGSRVTILQESNKAS